MIRVHVHLTLAARQRIAAIGHAVAGAGPHDPAEPVVAAVLRVFPGSVIIGSRIKDPAPCRDAE